ncbi:MAG: hypothetical protein RLZZ628_3353 [Bacteroidota bacterium]|jgi:hypothetical protein
MKFFLFALFCLVACAVTAQTQVYPVQAPIVRHVLGNPANVVTYMNLDTAITAASDGDVYYLHGGMPYSYSTTLNKRITMYGTGYNSDTSAAMGTSVVLGTFTLGANAKGSLFVGINFSVAITQNVNIAEPVYFRRCKFKYSSNNNTIQLDLRECIIEYISVGYSQNSIVSASNCVFETYLSSYSGSYHNHFVANNSIFLGYQPGYNNIYGYGFIMGFESTTVTNSIFFVNINPSALTTGNLLGGGTSAGIQNCLIVGDVAYLGSVDTTSNIRKDLNTFKDNVFVKRDLLFLQNSSDYHLQAALLNNADVRYRNMGIYRFNGADYPFKATPPVHVSSRGLNVVSNGRFIQFTGKVVDGN